MKYFVAGIVAILCGFLSYITLDKKIMDKINILKSKEGQYESKIIKEKKVIFLTIVIGIAGFECMVKILERVSDWINICKMTIALLCLIGSACVDYREHRIPNVFSMCLAGCGAMMLILSWLTKQPGAQAYVVSSLVAAIICFLGLLITSILTRQGIGAGDIKLISALAIDCGVYTVCGTMFYGIFACSAVALYFLVTRKKTAKESLPFGPFIAVGYIISIFSFNF